MNVNEMQFFRIQFILILKDRLRCGDLFYMNLPVELKSPARPSPLLFLNIPFDVKYFMLCHLPFLSFQLSEHPHPD